MTALVTWVWQGTIVAAVAGSLVQLIPHLNAATRYVIWWIALVMVIIHPWTFSVVPPEAMLTTAGAAAAGRVLLVLPSPPPGVSSAALVLWLSVVGFRIVQIARGMFLIQQLKRHSRALDPELELRLRMWSSVRETGRRPELRVSRRARGACALGFRRPVILLPDSLLGALSDEELDQVVMHEHAHVMRRDDWSRLFQCVVASLVGLHPVLWFIGTRIDLEREAACDDDVVTRTGAPQQYARCLTRVAAVILGPERTDYTIVPTAIGPSAMLRSRITRLLNAGSDRTPRLKWIVAAGSLVTLAVAVVGSDHIPPLVAFTENQASVPAPAPKAVHTGTPMLQLEAAPVTATRVTPRGTTHPRTTTRVAARSVPAADTTRGISDGALSTASFAPLALIDRRPLDLSGTQAPWPTVPVVLERLPARAESPRTDGAFRMIGARAARAGLSIAGHARGLGEAVSQSLVATADRVTQEF